MYENKPIISVNEQIAHLKNNGVTFNIMNTEEAKEYLLHNNNYFKLTAYRKNYDKHPDGENAGKYIRLDFAYLVDLAIIDMKLRYQIIQMALDIEHHAKLNILLELGKQPDEDGYQIVTDYIMSLSDPYKKNLFSEINRNKGNIYCGEIISKYDGHYPIWAFMEIIPFGRLIGLYKFCAERFNNKRMKNEFYYLLSCRDIRNAAAHNNCIINKLHSGTAQNLTGTIINRELMKISGMSKKFRSLKMSNIRIQQFVTLLYTHKTMVKSNGIIRTQSVSLNKLIARMYKNSTYYNESPLISGTFDFLKLVIDKWYPLA